MSNVAAERQKSEPPATDPRRVLTLCSGVTFIAFLDFFVVNIAFPDISRDFHHTPINSVTWVVSGYAAMVAAALAPAGRVADSIGRRRVFLWSLVVFTLASVACGFAPSIGWLIAARFVQGAAAGGMIPSALGLILACTPRERIPRAIGTWSAAAGFSAVVGPAVGGVLLHAFGWRSVFFINLPFGCALLVGAVIVLPRQLPGSGDRLPDPAGSLGLGLGIAGIVTALTEGDSWGWHSARTLTLGIVGVVLVLAAVARSRTRSAPAIDTDTWRNPAYSIANLGLALLCASMFAWNIGAPLFATTIWHWSVLKTAAALTIGAVSSMAGSLLAGRLVDQAKRLAVAMLGCALLAASNLIWASALFGTTPNFLRGWLPAAVLGGLGLGIGLTCLSTVAAGAMLPVKFAGGLGMTLAVRQVGGAVGVAGFAAILAAGSGPTHVAGYHHVFVAAAAVSIVSAFVIGGLKLALRVPATTGQGA